MRDIKAVEFRQRGQCGRQVAGETVVRNEEELEASEVG